jgi:hypothetical protein
MVLAPSLRSSQPRLRNRNWLLSVLVPLQPIKAPEARDNLCRMSRRVFIVVLDRKDVDRGGVK